MTALDLHGKTAIVTGASRGIGLAAQVLATAAANMVLTSRKQESAEEAAAQVTGSAIGVAAHALDEEQARRCIDRCHLVRFQSTRPLRAAPSAFRYSLHTTVLTVAED